MAGVGEKPTTVRDVLARLGVDAELWITLTGFSTWRGEDRAQVQALSKQRKRPWNGFIGRRSQDRESASGSGFVSLRRARIPLWPEARGWQPEVAVQPVVGRRRWRLCAEAVRAADSPPAMRAGGAAHADHRRRGIHRHQPRGPAAVLRTARDYLRRSFTAGQWSATWHGCASSTAISLRVEVADVRRPARHCGAPCGSRNRYFTLRRRWRLPPA